MRKYFSRNRKPLKKILLFISCYLQGDATGTRTVRMRLMSWAAPGSVNGVAF